MNWDAMKNQRARGHKCTFFRCEKQPVPLRHFVTLNLPSASPEYFPSAVLAITL